MKASELGEFGLIDILARLADSPRDRQIKAGHRLMLGIGDDAAAWADDGTVTIATTDCLIQGVHFTLEIISWADLGWRALAANLSDIAAMGGVPRYALVTLALPGDTEVADVTDLYRGMLRLGRRFGVAIAGGDTSSAPLVMINIAVLGSLGQGKHLLTRGGARVGDKIAVTGHLGAAAAGLEVLTRNLFPQQKGVASLKKAFLRPQPRVAEGQLLAATGASAAIDISDGLVSDLRHLSQASRVGARIETARLPIPAQVKAKFGDRALTLALAGGEDYELLFTASASAINRIRKTIPCPVTIIGDITAAEAGTIEMVDSYGNRLTPPRMGWEHFAAGAT